MFLAVAVLALAAAAKVTFTWTDVGDSTCGGLYSPTHWADSTGTCTDIMYARLITVVGLLVIAGLAVAIELVRRRAAADV
jgi:hypothetical protein